MSFDVRKGLTNVVTKVENCGTCIRLLYHLRINNVQTVMAENVDKWKTCGIFLYYFDIYV